MARSRKSPFPSPRGRRPKSSSGAPAPTSRSVRPSNLATYLTSFREYQPIEWIRSGIPAIDLVIGAGIPRGRFIEVVGEPSTAKSAFGYTVIGAFQRAGGECVLIDSEKKADRSFVERLGVDWERLHYSGGDNMKSCIQLLANIAQMADPKQPVLVVWDSLASTPGSWEMEQHIKDKEFTGEHASRARYFSAALRAIGGLLSRKQVTVIGINQLRTKFNFMGSASLDAPGGKAIKFHAAVRLMLRQKGKIVHKTRDVVTGIQVEVETIKNTVAPPFRKCLVKLYFDTGFAPYSGLDELLLRHGRLTQKAGWLVFGDRTFRAGDIERVVTEIPDLLMPLNGVIDGGAKEMDLSSAAASVKDTEDAEDRKEGEEDVK